MGRRLQRLDVTELRSIQGVGVAKACQIAVAFELARRHLLKEKTAIRKAEDVLPFIQHIADKKQEYLVCVSLNGANEVIESRVVTVGLLNTNQVHYKQLKLR